MTLLDQATFDKFGYETSSLSKGSDKKVYVECDYCKIRIVRGYRDHIRSEKNLKKDACKNCGSKKQREIRTGSAAPDYLLLRTFGLLKVICFSHYKDRRGYKMPHVFCECSCGGMKTVLLSSLLNGVTRSCGCLVAVYNQGMKMPYGTLVNGVLISSPAYKKSHKYYSNFVCPKCSGHFIARNSDVVNGSTRSCGNCGLMRNGQNTSRPALDMDKIISTTYITEHNHRPDDYKEVGLHHKSSIDIAIPDLMVAIEYDSYAHHRQRWGDKSESDKKKRDLLIAHEWKVLTIYANGQIPTESQIFSHIDKLINTDAVSTSITMPDWTIAENKQLVKH